MTYTPKFADKVRIENLADGTRRLYLDGEEFPWFTNGFGVETGDRGVTYLNVRIFLGQMQKTGLWEIVNHDLDRNPDGTLTDESSARVTAEFDADFTLGQACSITDPDCEACQ